MLVCVVFADFACHSYQHNILEMFLYLVHLDLHSVIKQQLSSCMHAAITNSVTETGLWIVYAPRNHNELNSKLQFV